MKAMTRTPQEHADYITDALIGAYGLTRNEAEMVVDFYTINVLRTVNAEIDSMKNPHLPPPRWFMWNRGRRLLSATRWFEGVRAVQGHLFSQEMRLYARCERLYAGEHAEEHGPRT